MKVETALLALILYARASAAPPTELVCTLAGAGLIHVDGLLDDWEGIAALTKADADPKDAALAVRCAYDAERLYIAVDVSDDRLIRTKQKTADEDHLVFLFGAQTLEIYPASAEHGAKLAWGWIGKKGGSKVTVADSLQKHGWSVELALGLRGLPGYERGAPGVTVAIELHDVDSFTDRRTQTILSTGDVLLSFEEAAAGLKAFLDGVHLHRGDVTLDVAAEVDGEPGLERVVAAGKLIGLVGAGYTYLELPVASARDVLSVELADLGGTGRQNLVVRTVERGNGGSREVLSIWSAKGREFTRLFAHEIAKQVGKNRLADSWQLVPRGRGGKGGMDLVIKAGEATGFTPATWNETPATDMVPILLPWGEKKQETWHFEGDVVSGG